MTCGSIKSICGAGFCSPEVCTLAQNSVNCKCGPTNPTSAPTISIEPSASLEPSFKAENDPCGICGRFESFKPLENKVINIPVNIPTPTQMTGIAATCIELEELCLGGFCKPELCQTFESVRTFCGCLPPQQAPCNVCPSGEEPVFPNAEVELTADQALLGVATAMTCGSLDGICEAGFCSPEVCTMARNECECRPTNPTPAPTTSMEPTLSLEPSYRAEFLPCGVCGAFASFVPLKSNMVEVPPGVKVPLQITGRKAPCTEFETLCLDGFCDPSLCATLLSVSDFCGCLASTQRPCNVCPEGEEPSTPDMEISLTANQAPMGAATTMTCASIKGVCEAGFCSPQVCTSAQNDSRCRCRPTNPTPAPTVSVEPTISQQPSFNAGNPRCSLCGGPPINYDLANVNVNIPAEISPPQVTSGIATCMELEIYCEGGFCTERMCLSFQQSIAGTCGCQA